MNQIEVTIELHPRQYVGHNKWKCTIDGEERLVTNQRVRFSVNNFNNISNSFNLVECVDVSIHWNRESYYDGKGGKIYYD